MPPTEILQTFADITTSTQLLGFKPLTDLKTGMFFQLVHSDYHNSN